MATSEALRPALILTPAQQLAVVEASRRALAHEAAKRRQSKFKAYFPDCQPGCKPDSPRKQDHVGFCRVLYRRHLEFFSATKLHGATERLFMAANRIGKTEAAAYELTAHLTGEYPRWWPGVKFAKPIKAWVAGDTMLSTRDILQVSLMGEIDGVDVGRWSGMIPAHLVARSPIRRSGGVGKCLETVWVKHKTGGESILEFKSYDQGRKVFQGTEQHLIWLDEEPPDPPTAAATTGEGNDIYTECLLRTLTTQGLIIATFTPIRGLTPFVQGYLETAQMMDAEGHLGPANTIIWPEAA